GDMPPAFTSAHSHAFQIGLRGDGEQFPPGAADFWSWRQAMYGLVERMNPDLAYALASRCYQEMLAAGIQTVGEFHYLRHASTGQPDFVLDQAILQAAHDTGIELVLLPAAYEEGGPGVDLAVAQQRFVTGGFDQYWKRFDQLQGELLPGQTIQACVHSLRAVPWDQVQKHLVESHHRGLRLHVHLEEQPRELKEIKSAYGAHPVQLLLNSGLPLEHVVGVHMTQTSEKEMVEWLGRGGMILPCPLTEGDLGDGVPILPDLPDLGTALALGTDSNLRISMFEEMRRLEHDQRCRTLRRGALRCGGTAPAQVLWSAASTGGRRALGLPMTGPMLSIDEGHALLAGAKDSSLLDALVFGADERVLRAV
ncbi:MAG: hypothetical protein CMJ28_03035, partial [Phycisphaerae bacterium]|nr:hypothetical protein [Phycisphaerae bacterium]